MSADVEAGAVAERIGRLRARNAAAADLAVLCSLAVRVEPALLRRLRLLLSGAAVDAEADLWASDLVSAATVRGLVIDHAAADLLRHDLAQPAWARWRREARALVLDSHRGLDWALRLEEEVQWLQVSGEADAPGRAERLLLAAVKRLAGAEGGPSTDQTGIARWLASALARLPGSVAASDAARVAGLGAALRLSGTAPGDGGGAIDDQWLPWLLAQAGTPPVAGPVRFTPGRLHVNESGPDAVTVSIPATDPLVLDVDWHDGSRNHRARLRWRGEEAVTLDVAADEVLLTTLAGEGYRLRLPRAGAAGGFDFSAERARARPCLARGRELDELYRRVLAGQWTAVAGEPGSGKTVLAVALADRVEREGGTVAQHFLGVRPEWDEPGLVAASIEAQLRSAVEGDSPTLVLIDGIDGIHGDEPELPLHVAEGAAMVTTGTAPRSLESGGLVSLDDDPDGQLAVCEAILAADAPGLRLALGDDVPPEAVIERCGPNPGRVAAAVGWALDQPVGEARLAEVPLPLTVEWDEVVGAWEGRFATSNVSRWLAALAVAGEGLSVGDLQLVAGGAEELFADFLLALADEGLVVPAGPLDDPATGIRPPHPSLAERLVARFGPVVLASGHAAHLQRSVDPDHLSPYGIASAVRHALGADEHETAARLCRSVRFLDRRAREGGVDSVLGDLAAAGAPVSAVRSAAEAVAPVASDHPERFGDLVVNELHRLGREHEVTVDDPWAPGLRLESVHRLQSPEPAWSSTEAVTLAAALDDGRFAVATATTVEVLGRSVRGGVSYPTTEPATAVGGGRDGIVLAHGTDVSFVPPGSTALEPLGGVGSVVTAVAATDAWVAVGTAAGTIAAGPSGSDGDWPRGTLAGHGGAVTVLATTEVGTLLSGSADGTVRVCDVQAGTCRLVFRDHRAAVTHVLGLKGPDVVSADESGRILWWNQQSGDVRRAMAGHTGAVTGLVRDGHDAVVSAGRDGTLRRWRLTDDPRADRTSVPGGPPILHLLAVEGGFVTWDANGRLTWWDRDGERGATLHPAGIEPPVHGLFADHSAPGTVVIAHAGGLSAHTPPDAPAGDDEGAGAGALAVTGASVFAGTPTGGTWLDLSTGTTSTRAETPPTAGPSPTPTTDVLVARDQPDRGVLRDLLASVFPAPHDVAEVVWLRTGHVVPLGFDPGWVEDLIARAAAGGWLPQLVEAAVRHVPHHRAAHLLCRAVPATGGPDGTVTVAGFPPLRRSVTPVTALAAEAGRLVIGDDGGGITLWDLRAPAPVELGTHGQRVTGVVMAGPSVAVSAGADGTLRAWDLDARIQHAIVAGPEPFHALAIDPDGGPIVARHGHDEVWVLDLDPQVVESRSRTLLEPFAHLRVDHDDSFVRPHEDADGPTTLEVSLAFEARTTVALEIRDATVTAADLPPSGPAQLSIDGDWPLVPPATRRLAADQPVTVAARQRFVPLVEPGPDLAVTLHLTLASPGWRAPWVWEIDARFAVGPTGSIVSQQLAPLSGEVEGHLDGGVVGHHRGLPPVVDPSANVAL